MSNNRLNLSILFSVAFGSLALGYYLGQISPGPGAQDRRRRRAGARRLPNSSIGNVTEGDISREDEEYDEEGGSEYSDVDEDEEEEDEDLDEEDYEISSLSLNEVPGEVRMALVIRQDLKMERGKIAAQCCHAAVGCYRLIATDPSRKSYNPVLTDRWLKGGQAKITLKCPDKEMLDELYAKAISLGVNALVIHDAGRTQVAPGSATVLGLGPAPKPVLDQITGDLKLY